MPRYIDADMLWDKISRAYQFEDRRGVLGYVKQCLNEAHTADVQEVKHGKWIYGQDEIFVSCSECGMETTRNEIRGIALFGKDEPKFCPNCGAKMERENSKSNE